MSLEDSFKKRVANCCKGHEIIYKQIPVLLEKIAILLPAENRMQSSEPLNKSETKKPVAPLTPEEILERSMDLNETIKGFLKELADAEKETGGACPATPPSSVEDK